MGGGRTLVIGDIHGGLKALKQVLKRAKVKPSDQLIFLGDYVDGWSDSAKLIDFLIELKDKFDCKFLRGNHDELCYDWLLGKNGDSTWLEHGGKSTVKSYELLAPNRGKHRDFFYEMESYFIDEENRLFVHAGFTSPKGPEKEFHKSNFSWDRTLWKLAMESHDKKKVKKGVLPERLKLFKEIYIGHTPTTKFDVTHPWQRVNIWNMDTGAAFKGRLSIMDIDSKEYWQSDRLHKLYPEEKGRNK